MLNFIKRRYVMKKSLLLGLLLLVGCAASFDMQQITGESEFLGESQGIKSFIKIAPLGMISGHFAHITIFNSSENPIQMNQDADLFYVFNQDGRFRIVPLVKSVEIEIQYPDYVNSDDFTEVFCQLPDNVPPGSIEKFQILVNFKTVDIELIKNPEKK